MNKIIDLPCFFVFALLTTVSLISGCTKNSLTHRLADDKIIYGAGEYIFISGETLKIEITTGGIVTYQMLDKGGRELFRNNEHASIYQRWEAYRESSNSRLWVYSSDIGCFLWQMDESGKYSEVEVDEVPNSLIATMPKLLFDSLPNSMKSRWSKFRKAE